MGGRSSSTQQQSTANTDARVVADAGAIGISGSGNTVNVTDSGLVNAAFDYLKGADAAITDRNNQVLTVAGNTAQLVIDAGMKAGADAVSAAVNTLSTIDRAKGGTAFDNSQIIAALIGAAALVLTVGKG